ncbi:hypothetical protein VNI00_006881 [Paramarasmius palmivorus]|uniref:F-box domain-containing protein n=1 Tax=Paramarasmius palmivorus TaxID=297713 RepID=A0AAW0D6V5_9AGAR
MLHPPIPREALRWNRLPSKAEIAQTRLVIQDEESQISRYEEEIGRRNGLFRTEVLEMEKAVLNRKIEERRSWLAPIRRLPHEVLEVILRDVCLPADYSLKVTDSGTQITCTPFLLSQVSTYWRAVVKSCPTLWHSISVDIYNLQRDITPLLTAYLDNARGTPLKLQIIDPNQDDAEHFGKFAIPSLYLGRNGHKVFQVLVRCIPRCQELDLQIDSDMLNGLKPSLDSGYSFPLLRSFRDNTITWSVRPESLWFWESIRNASALTELVTSSPEILSTFPCHQLTTVTFGHITTTQLYDFLSNSQNLKSLTVQILNHTDGALGLLPYHTTVLPHLSSVVLTHCFCLNKLDKLFNAITLPALTRLTLSEDGRGDTESWDITSFLSLLSRSSCPLQDFAIHFWGSVVHPHLLADILREVPHLQTLVLIVNRDVVHEVPCFDLFLNGLFEQLIIEPGKPILSPRLSSLHVAGNSRDRSPVLTPKTGNILVQMAQSRSRMGLVDRGLMGLVSALDDLQLSFALGSAMARLQALEGQGMRIVSAWD